MIQYEGTSTHLSSVFFSILQPGWLTLALEGRISGTMRPTQRSSPAREGPREEVEEEENVLNKSAERDKQTHNKPTSMYVKSD